MAKDKILVIAFLASFLVSGMVDSVAAHHGATGPTRATAFIHALTCALILYFWCKNHAVRYGVDESKAAPALCGLICVVGVPLYFIRAFGWRKGLVGCAKALGILLFAGVLYPIGQACSALLTCQ